MGSASAKCVSKPSVVSPTPTDREVEKSVSNQLSVNRSVSRSVSTRNPWCGEWTYIIKNQVHSFDITEHKGKLVYSENMGPKLIFGKVVTKEGSQSARIVAKDMNFEIDINRETMVARYRTRGSKKWTKEIGLMKVDEIEDETTDGEHSLSWNKSTLRNTWKNTSIRDGTLRADTLRKDDSIRGCSLRKANSLKMYTAGQTQSINSDDVEALFRQNSTRKSIRFEDECRAAIAELIEEAEEDSDKENS